MIIALRVLFVGVLIAMMFVTTWASRDVALWNTPRSLWTHPWVIATLCDTYFAFLTFWLWVAYKERSGLARAGWLVAILLTGNFAMATYVLIQLFKLPATAPLHRLFVRNA
ncbi:MAG: DUF1475 family protein [Chthoniobacteraceae bacterium]